MGMKVYIVVKSFCASTADLAQLADLFVVLQNFFVFVWFLFGHFVTGTAAFLFNDLGVFGRAQGCDKGRRGVQ